MKVIVLHAQQSLITDGPYRFSRHPLYLGGNVLMFLGATLLLGTPSGVVLTIAHWLLMDWMMRREEATRAKIRRRVDPLYPQSPPLALVSY
jgi:protein-S-isoprenylcysteine O-methyltransferase Ste14